MKTLVTFTTPTTTKHKHSPEVGQIYKKTNNPDDLYMIVQLGGDTFNIINLMSGMTYSSYPSNDINEVFCGNDELFVLIKKVEMIVS